MANGRDLARDRAVLEAVVGPPQRTMTSVAAEYGLSRERVRQLLARQGVTGRSLPRTALEQQETCSLCSGAYRPGLYRAHVAAARHRFNPPGRSGPADEARDLAVAAAYRSGSSARDLAASLGLAVAAVYVILHRAGLWPRGPRPRNRRRNEDIAVRYLRGESRADIAARYGLSPWTIVNIVRYQRLLEREP